LHISPKSLTRSVGADRAHLNACSPHRRTCHVRYETGRLSDTGRPLQRPSGHCLSTRQNACATMELEGSSTQRFAARDHVFRRQPALRSSTRSTSNDGRSGFLRFSPQDSSVQSHSDYGFTAGLGDRGYCLSRTTRPDGGRAAWRTPCRTHPQVGVVASFCFAAAFSAFSWYAMRHGALLGGTDSTSLVHDLRSLPGIMLNFVLAVPRTL
jgi:hypothetical protein